MARIAVITRMRREVEQPFRQSTTSGNVQRETEGMLSMFCSAKLTAATCTLPRRRLLCHSKRHVY